MQRPLFLLIAAGLGFLFGGLMFLAPGVAATSFGVSVTPETTLLFRATGAAVLALGLMNLLARNAPDSPALAAILWTNVAGHALALAADLIGVAGGAIGFGAILPGAVVHVLIAAGSARFLGRMS